MTGSAWTLVAAFLVFAALDWVAVAGGRRSLEAVAKPFAMLPLIGAALALDPVDGAMRVWFVVGLILSLAGDVLLLDDRTAAFQGGLAAFLAAHLCYAVGFVLGGITWWAAGVGLLVVLALLAPLAPRLLAGVRRDDPTGVAPVAAYVVVIAAMFVTACGSTVMVAVFGALLFVISDLTLGWSRFVRELSHSSLLVMITYHLGQLLLVLSLVIAR